MKSDVVYTLSLTIVRSAEGADASYKTEAILEWMKSADAKRELEREVLKALRVLDGDCDVEVMEVDTQ